MPRLVQLKAPDGSWYKAYSMYADTIEKTSPLLWFGALGFFLLTKLNGLPENVSKEIVINELKSWGQKPCPYNLVALYDTKNKKEQERLLRGKTFTPENLICWILQGGCRGGLLSQYSFDGGISKEFEGRAPFLIDITDSEKIISIGKTDLSDNALVHIVENQSKVIAQFMDFPDGRWYCFYRTHRGLAGRESGNHGQHLHFISSAYGVKRELLVEGFKQGRCPSNGFHVRISGYG